MNRQMAVALQASLGRLEPDMCSLRLRAACSLNQRAAKAWTISMVSKVGGEPSHALWRRVARLG